jgi:hypothetical protein
MPAATGYWLGLIILILILAAVGLMSAAACFI